METTGLVLAVATAVVQLSGVVKRHVTAFSTLDTLASSIESKAIQVCSVASQFRGLTEITCISAELFVNTLENLRDIHERLTNIKQKIQNWKRTGMLILQAPVFGRELRDLETELTRLDFFLRTVYTLGSMISAQRTEMRELLISTLLRFADSERRGDQGRQILLDFNCGLLAQETCDLNLETDADHAFVMGLASYDFKPEKVRVVTTPVGKVRSAARYFNKACELDKKEAFRYLGDIFYDGIGATKCFRKAVTLYDHGVARNDAGAKFALGWCYDFGHGVDPVPEKARELYNEAIAGGCGEAMAVVGHLNLHTKLGYNNHCEAVRLLKKADKMNVFSAKESLAWCYDRGIGVDYDPAKAFELFKETFYGGDLLATGELANCYDAGSGVAQNAREASKVYEHCMNSGTWEWDFYKAYYGLRLIQGLGVEKDEPRGMALILNGTKNGITWHALDECYRHGLGVRKDLTRAKQFYRNAVSCAVGIQGIANSYIALGEMFEVGEGVCADIRRANKYYFCAAERLEPLAQWKVAVAFESGIGLRKNVHRAVFYYEMCANSGHREAQRKYIAYYMKGHVIERSRVYVREMIEEAARVGNMEAKQWLKREKRRRR